MADTQSTVYGQAYGANIMQLAQQGASKLMGTVFQKPNVKGKTFFQDQIGEWAMEVKAGRNSQTPNNDPALARRMGLMIDYHDNRMLDRGDELRTISDPRSAYSVAGAQSMGRKFDDIIIAAMHGTAYYGETGSSSLTNSNVVLMSVANITMAQLLSVKKTLDDKDVPMEDRYWVATTTFMNNLLDVSEATSADYAAIKALVRGEMDTWLGFKWIMSTRVNSSHLGYAYHKTGVCLAGMDGSPMVKTDQRADLSYSWQLYYEINAGAVRLEENKVVVVKEG